MPQPSKELNFRLDLDALAILERFAPPGSHMKGRFLSRLLFGVPGAIGGKFTVSYN